MSNTVIIPCRLSPCCVLGSISSLWFKTRFVIQYPYSCIPQDRFSFSFTFSLRRDFFFLPLFLRSKSRRRSKRSVSRARHVETMVVVDKKMRDYHHNIDHEGSNTAALTAYILTIMNIVSTSRYITL